MAPGVKTIHKKFQVVVKITLDFTKLLNFVNEK